MYPLPLVRFLNTPLSSYDAKWMDSGKGDNFQFMWFQPLPRAHACACVQVLVCTAVPITVELGVYINYIYAISEQTMVLTHTAF